MTITLSKEDLEYIIDLVKDNSNFCKSQGFQGHDELINKLENAKEERIRR